MNLISSQLFAASTQLRVLLVVRPDVYRVPGGDTSFMLHLQRDLQALGAWVDIAAELFPDPGGYDLIYVLNLLIPSQTYRQMAALRARTQAPIVLLPLYWDMGQTQWNEVVVPEAIASAAGPEELAQTLAEIEAGTLRRGAVTRVARNRPYADYENDQQSALDLVDHLILISQREQELLERNLVVTDQGRSVILSGVDVPARPADPSLFRQTYGLHDFVLVSGRVEGRKNQLMLLLALQGTDLPVVVMGGQPDPAYLKLCQRFAPPNTIFTGRVSDEMIASARAAARVHALPSWWECAGLASIEAALEGCAIVVGNQGAEDEYCGEWAYYADPGSVTSIREAVLTAYHNYEQDAPRRQALRAKMQAEFTWRGMAKQTLAVFEQLLHPAQPRPSQQQRERRITAQAQLRAMQDNPTSALAAVDLQVPVSQHNVGLLALAGMQYFALGHAALAEPLLGRAYAYRPQNNQVGRVYGQTLVNVGRLPQAERVLAQVVAEHPDDEQAYWWLAQALLRQNKLTEAAALLQAAVAAFPLKVQFFASLNACYQALGKLTAASAGFQQTDAQFDRRAAILQEKERSAQTLQRLLDAADPTALVRANPDLCDLDLMHLIAETMQKAQNEGKLEQVALLRTLRRQALAALGPREAAAAPTHLRVTCCGDRDQVSYPLRVQLPAEMLARHGHQVVERAAFSLTDLAASDLFIFSRPHLDPNLALGVTLCHEAGKLVVIDLDDDFHHLPADHPGYHRVGPGNPASLRLLEELLAQADLVTFATETLAEVYRPWAKRGAVMPNGWSRQQRAWLAPSPARQTIHLGWAGTITHRQDVELMRKPLLRILAAYPQTRLVIGGDPQVYTAFAEAPEAQRVFHPFVSAAEYPRLLAEFDILLAPLRPNAFNQAKSDLKLLEAGIRRIPWVASPSAAYRAWAVGGLLATSEADWERALVQLIENAAARAQLGAQGHAQALTREAEKLAGRWAALCADLAQTVAAERRAQEALQWLIQAEDPTQAVREHPERLDAALLALVRTQAGTAQARGEAEEAEALAALAEFIAAQAGSPADAAQERAAATLEWLLESDDIAAALAQAGDRLDAALLALVQANARAARAAGDLDLAAGLDDLAAVIGDRLTNVD